MIVADVPSATVPGTSDTHDTSALVATLPLAALLLTAMRSGAMYSGTNGPDAWSPARSLESIAPDSVDVEGARPSAPLHESKAIKVANAGTKRTQRSLMVTPS